MRGGKKSVLNNQQFSCFCFLYIESHARQLITFVRMADEWLGLNCDGIMRSETRIDFSFRRSLLARPFSGGHDDRLWTQEVWLIVGDEEGRKKGEETTTAWRDLKSEDNFLKLNFSIRSVMGSGNEAFSSHINFAFIA